MPNEQNPTTPETVSPELPQNAAEVQAARDNRQETPVQEFYSNERARGQAESLFESIMGSKKK